jgi:hypothetical protein
VVFNVRVLRWQVGDVEVVRIADLDFAVPSPMPLPDWCVPAFGPSSREYFVAFTALAIRDGDTRIVVDPWLANDDPRDEAGAADHAAALLAQLADAGFAPPDVDLVVNTHLDGVGWNTRPDGDGGWVTSFPNARYSYPADEVAAIERGDDVYGHEAWFELAGFTEIDRIEGTRHLTEAVSVEPAPGHNAGHHAVRIEHGGDLALYPGHLVLNPLMVADPGESPDEDPATTAVAAESRRLLLSELADRGGLLLTTLLGGDGAGRVQRAGDGFALTPA